LTTLQLFSEQYRPEGNIDARATRRAIGRPHLGFWEGFLRETLQNSWDARLPDATKIRYRVEGFFASPDQIQALRDEVFTSEPDNMEIGALLDSEEVPILVVTDSHTKGLQGPTRADLATDEPTHFIDFVRNIGRAHDKAIGGGGTYGFGKGVLYDASVCTTIVVFTRTTNRGARVSRLIAIGQGDSYNDDQLRFTGRHWWGIAGGTTAAEPLTDSAAEALASRLGINRIPDGETGTSIAVIGPVAQDDETLDQIVDKVATAAMHWAWPHMIGTGAGATIDFTFTADGEEVTVPQPSVHPLYRHYAGAYRRATAILAGQEVSQSWPWQDHQIRSERPKADLGVLVYKNIRREDLPSGDGTVEPQTAHVALMRDPRLVVRYMDVPQNPQGLATIGVFVAHPAMNEQFATSEPVAHDDWAPENLRTERYERNPVKQTLDKIRRTFRATSATAPSAQGDVQTEGAVRLANALGDLLAGIAPGVDPRIQPRDGGILPPRAGAGGGGRTAGSGGDSTGGAGSRVGRRRMEPSAAIVGTPSLELVGSRLAAMFEVRVSVPEGRNVVIRAEPRVVLDGGAAEPASDRPAGAVVPQVLGWSSNGGRPDGSSSYRPSTPGESIVGLWISQPPDTAVSVLVQAVEEHDA